MSKPRAPTPPDPAATIAAQTAANRTNAVDNAYANNVNQTGPYGSTTYDVTGSGPNGIPRWTQTTTESDNQRQIRTGGEELSIALGGIGNQQAGRVAELLGTPYDPRRFDTNAVTGGALDINSALGDYSGDVEARSRELATRGLGKMFDDSEERLHSTLANQGINLGSQAYADEKAAFNVGKGDAYAQAELGARGQAQSDRQQQLSELLAQRGGNLGEAQQQFAYDQNADLDIRQRPLNEINALQTGAQLSNTPINPGQPNNYNIANTDTAGITNQGYQNQLGVYTQQMNARNALLGGLAGLGGAAITASDPRLKRDITYHRTDAKGLRWWFYRYFWEPASAPLRRGVMATEAPAHAVSRNKFGFLQVDYGAL